MVLWGLVGCEGSGGIEFGWLEFLWVDSGEARCGSGVKAGCSIARYRGHWRHKLGSMGGLLGSIKCLLRSMGCHQRSMGGLLGSMEGHMVSMEGNLRVM